MVDPIDRRLTEIESRLVRLETLVGSSHTPAPPRAPPIQESTPPRLPGERPPIAEAAATRGSGFELSASTILGWAGAGALLLASAYFVRLAIAEGWLTPWLQVAIAAVAGSLMIGGAFALRSRDTRYSSLLGAGGIAILYVAVYGAHVYHALIGSFPATVAVGAVSTLSLILHARFRQTVYVAFALGGTYLTPLLLPRGSIQELSLYLGIWNLVYAAYAVWQRSRAFYLASLYTFLLVFGWGWGREIAASVTEAARLGLPRLDDRDLPRVFAGVFLWVQAVLYLVAAVAVSKRARKPLTDALAWAHFPALLVFYGIQYQVLGGGYGMMGLERAHLAARWGIALALAVYAGWAVGRVMLEESPRASLAVAHAFAAFVFLHAVHFQLVAAEWRPMVALGVAALILGATWSGLRAGPWLIAAVVLLVAGYSQLAVSWDLNDGQPVVGRAALSLAYPALLYAVYFSIRPSEVLGARELGRWLLLGAAHSMALGAAVWLVGEWLGSPETTVERLWLSFAWAAIGLAWLLLGTARGDRTLARSTLWIFAAFAIKVVFADLDHAGPLVRVGILVVLGLTLYAGGWIYRRVVDSTT